MEKLTITEYKFTHAELVAWFANQFHDDILIRWADVQTWADRTMDIGNLIDFCEQRERKEKIDIALARDSHCAHLDELDDAPEKPALSRFLPRRPDEHYKAIPELKEGYVFVSEKGVDSDAYCLSQHIAANRKGDYTWNYGPNKGTSPDCRYAIRWTAPVDIWHRFGLLAPSEGGGWIPHAPGDCSPVAEKVLVDVILKNGETDISTPAYIQWQWSWMGQHEITGWRPALAEVRS
jgi:hypothetical protein